MKTNQIYKGDCLELLPSIPDKSIDMILCDLPYGTTACEWDSIIPLNRLWEQYERVIKDNGAICLTANSHFVFTLHASNPKLFRYKWVWMKSRKTRFLDANRKPLGQHEDILTFYKSLPCYNPQMNEGKPYFQSHKKSTIGGKSLTGDHKLVRKPTINNGAYYPSDLIYFANETGDHPTQKPVALFEYLIRTYSNEREVILDNCSGSGTTAIACLNSNRRFICIEKDETYYKRSLERIANHEPLLHLASSSDEN
jgi:site-specific DNA-methyltransferase (adenine-specific)